MSNQTTKFNNYAQTPSRAFVVKNTGQDDCVHSVRVNSTSSNSALVVRNPAPEASPPSTPSRFERMVVSC